MNYTSLSLEILKSVRGPDLAGMQLISKYNNEVRLLLCAKMLELFYLNIKTHPANACSNLTIATLEQGPKYVQS